MPDILTTIEKQMQRDSERFWAGVRLGIVLGGILGAVTSAIIRVYIF